MPDRLTSCLFAPGDPDLCPARAQARLVQHGHGEEAVGVSVEGSQSDLGHLPCSKKSARRWEPLLAGAIGREWEVKSPLEAIQLVTSFKGIPGFIPSHSLPSTSKFDICRGLQKPNNSQGESLNT